MSFIMSDIVSDRRVVKCKWSVDDVYYKTLAGDSSYLCLLKPAFHNELLTLLWEAWVQSPLDDSVRHALRSAIKQYNILPALAVRAMKQARVVPSVNTFLMYLRGHCRLCRTCGSWMTCDSPEDDQCRSCHSSICPLCDCPAFIPLGHFWCQACMSVESNDSFVLTPIS